MGGREAGGTLPAIVSAAHMGSRAKSKMLRYKLYGGSGGKRLISPGRVRTWPWGSFLPGSSIHYVSTGHGVAGA
eukprot:1875778-Rhodomonas_salina.4